MKSNQEKNFMNRADRLLYKETKLTADALVQDTSTPQGRIAYAFLSFMQRNGIPTHTIDESKLKAANTLEYMAETQNVSYSEGELPPLWHTLDIGSFICFHKDDECDTPVILERDLFGYYAINPFNGEHTRVNARNAQQYSGPVIMIFAVRAGKSRVTLFGCIKNALRFCRRELALLIAAAVVSAAIAMFIPFVTGYVVGYIGDAEASANILVLFIISTLVLTVSRMLNTAAGLLTARVEMQFSFTAMAEYIHKILALPAYVERQYANEIIGGTMQLLESMTDIMKSGLLLIFGAAQCVVIILIIKGMHIAVAEYALMFVYICTAAHALLLWLTKKENDYVRDADIAFTAVKKEMLDNIDAIKNNGVEERMFFRFAVAFSRYEYYYVRAQNVRNNIFTLNDILFGGAGVFIITLSAYVCHFTDVTYMASLLALFALLTSTMPECAEHLFFIISKLPSLKIMTKLMNAPSEAAATEGITDEISGNIELKNITFGYSDKRAPIINDLSLKIKQGEYIGITGESGCGKSTLIKLLLGFEIPQSGTVLYDGVPIEKFAIKCLRRQFGVILQNAGIISGTISMNISLSDAPDMNRMCAAARAAAIYDDIDEMPMKFDTLLSSDSNLISGGQKQRILLARALYNDPKILILDEATSALDNISQKKIKENLDALGITRISVAHRLSTIRNCDRIIVLHKGRIAEEGNFESLMQLNGMFAEMARRNM